MESKNLLELIGVTVTVGQRRILDGVSLRLAKGERVLITGPSGSGKSTLLEAILGGMPLQSGEIRFLGRPVGAQNIRKLRSRIAYVGQEPLLGGATAREGVLLPFGFKAHRGSKPGEEQLIRTLSLFGLEAAILRQEVSTLSGGEKQRLALARAFLLNLDLLLLDEVTSALDAVSSRTVWEYLSRTRETALLAISHDDPGIAFDQIWIMERGRLNPSSSRKM